MSPCVPVGPLTAAERAALREIVAVLPRHTKHGIGRYRLAGGMCPVFARFKAPHRQALLDRGVADGLFDRMRGPNEYGTWIKDCYFAHRVSP